MKRRKNIDTGKIVSIVTAGAILVALGVGVYAVTNMSGSNIDNNIVDLNETEAPNVAFRAEDVTDGVVGHMPKSSAADEGNQVADNHRFAEPDEIGAGNELATAEDLTDATKEAKNNKETAGAVVNAPAIVDPAAAYTFSADSSLIWPVKGDIIMPYSMESTILFKTLGVYRCNPAVLIQAEVGSNVGVAADGVVTKVTKSEETGTTVSVAVGSDYVVTYGQLEGVVVKAGDKVKKEQLLGTVAEPTAYYVEEGSHIYFAVTKAGVPVDPTDFLEN